MPNEFIAALPKAELHLHLEGSIEPATMRLLAPELSEEEIRGHYCFADFAGFLTCFKWTVEQLRTPEHYAIAALHLLKRLASQNVRYCEITLSAGVVLWKQQDLHAVQDALAKVARQQSCGIQVRWIWDAIRHFGPEPAMRVAEMAAERLADGVVAFGIGGDELRGPAEWFDDVYRFCHAKGLRLTAHAGETVGPESVWGALRIGAERIGHGIRAVDDSALLRELRDRNIPLEICISSNLATGAARDLPSHPVRRLFDAGVPIVLNTDDPALFDCTLNGEFQIAADCFGFSGEELTAVAQNGFKHAFG